MADTETVIEQQDRAAAGKAPAKVMEARVPMPLGGMFSRSLDGWALDPNWLGQIALNDDRVLQLEGYAPDLRLFDNLLDDDVAMSAFQ
jgi:protein-disulfide isomerase-like protein with CxxC motif